MSSTVEILLSLDDDGGLYGTMLVLFILVLVFGVWFLEKLKLWLSHDDGLWVLWGDEFWLFWLLLWLLWVKPDDSEGRQVIQLVWIPESCIWKWLGGMVARLYLFSGCSSGIDSVSSFWLFWLLRGLRLLRLCIIEFELFSKSYGVSWLSDSPYVNVSSTKLALDGSLCFIVLLNSSPLCNLITISSVESLIQILLF